MTSAQAAGSSRAPDLWSPRAAGAAPLPLSPQLIALAGLGTAFVVGAAFARGLPTGIALFLGVVYAPLALINLPLALSAWLALTFIAKLPIVYIAPNAASLIVLVAWLGGAAGRRKLPSAWVGAARGLPAAVGLLLAWLSVSALWAAEPLDVLAKAWEWIVAGIVMAIIATTMRTKRDIRLLLVGFVGGAVLSVAIGLAANGLSAGSTVYDTATSTEGRLSGGAGDPNYLAAGVVPAIVFALALLQMTRDPLARLALGTSAVVLVLGLAATQSRGGLIALAVAIFGSLAVMRGRRAPVIAMLLVMLAVCTGWFAANQDAAKRITSSDNGGNGRSELWTVAGRMFTDRPLLGVGLNNFREVAPDYTRDVGTLRFVKLIAERPHLVHNSYLQLLAETGLPGLALFLTALGLAFGSLRATARRFRAQGDREGLIIADAAFVALLAVAAASFFLSSAEDRLIWVLVGLAPALALISSRSETRGSAPRPA